MVAGRAGNEIIFGGAGHIYDAVELAGLRGITCTACHYVGVNIHGIDGVGDGDDIVEAEDFLDVARVAFCAVADEYFGFIEFDTAGVEIIFDNGFDEKIVALLRAVTAEGFSFGHISDGFFHRFYYGRRERLGDITDSKTDDFGIRVLGFKGAYSASDFREKIACLQFQEVFIN